MFGTLCSLANAPCRVNPSSNKHIAGAPVKTSRTPRGVQILFVNTGAVFDR